jgi:hypothetical protein
MIARDDMWHDPQKYMRARPREQRGVMRHALRALLNARNAKFIPRATRETLGTPRACAGSSPRATRVVYGAPRVQCGMPHLRTPRMPSSERRAIFRAASTRGPRVPRCNCELESANTRSYKCARVVPVGSLVQKFQIEPPNGADDGCFEVGQGCRSGEGEQPWKSRSSRNGA